MHNRNSRLDPPDRPNSANQAGVSAPAKGDSSGSHPPIDPDATLLEFPKPIEFPRPTFDSDATLVDLQTTDLDLQATQLDISPRPRPTNAGPSRPHRAVNVSLLQAGDVLG
ncbi:MAG: hypothetical protein WA859_18955, partial [Candidatus Sulfotelmatobacter sp.]